MTRQKEKLYPLENQLQPFVGLDNIEPYSMKATAVGPFGMMKSAASVFKTGDVLYGRLRPYLNKVWCAEYDGVCSGELIVLRPGPLLDAKYLAYTLHHDSFVDFAKHAVTGDRPRLDFSIMQQFWFPLPPLQSQRDIVARVDDLLAEVDDGEAALASARENLEVWRKALLKAAVTGELTADWRAVNPPTETGAELLARVLAERRARWLAEPRNKGKHYLEPTGPQMEGLLDLPEGWVWATSEQLSFFITKGTTPPKHLGATDPKTVPFIRVTNLTADGTLNFAESQFVSESIHRGFLQRSICIPGDVLMNIVGPPLGQVSIVPATFSEWNVNQAIARYRPVDGLSVDYFALVLRSGSAQKWLAARTKTTSGQVNLTLELCRAMPFPLPSICEQEQIVNAMAADHSDTQGQLTMLLAGDPTLRQGILSAAFRGTLTV